MTVTKAHVTAFKDLIGTFESLMPELQVTLVGGGTYTVKIHLGLRATGAVLTSSRSRDMTPGLDQDSLTAVISYDSWHASIPANRPPRRGDLVRDAMGNRYAIERCVLAAPAGVQMLYKAEVRG